MKIDLWLYGELSRYGNDAGEERAFAHIDMEMPEGSKMKDLLGRLGLPSDARGLTFVNGAISSMPGLYPDLEHVLSDGDRVGIFPPVSMLPFQYREGAPVVKEFAEAVGDMGLDGFAHDYSVHRKGRKVS